jgi:hypothetical protein
MIILLDLNFTLVANNPPRGTPNIAMHRRLPAEEYRQWLIDLIRSHVVILMTARPAAWQEATLESIRTKTGWSPHAACFAPAGWWNPPAIKEHLLRTEVFPEHGEDARYLAIESNPRTRMMYGRIPIPSIWVTGDGQRLTDGERILRRLPR